MYGVVRGGESTGELGGFKPHLWNLYKPTRTVIKEATYGPCTVVCCNTYYKPFKRAIYWLPKCIKIYMRKYIQSFTFNFKIVRRRCL